MTPRSLPAIGWLHGRVPHVGQILELRPDKVRHVSAALQVDWERSKVRKNKHLKNACRNSINRGLTKPWSVTPLYDVTSLKRKKKKYRFFYASPTNTFENRKSRLKT